MNSIKLEKKITENDDPYGTKFKSFQQRIDIYTYRFEELKDAKAKHMNNIANLKQAKKASENVIEFKKEENIKKMQNEILRLKEESKRNDDGQSNENKKIYEGADFVENLLSNNSELLECMFKVVLKFIFIFIYNFYLKSMFSKG